MEKDKHTHKAEAIQAMYAVISCDWAKTIFKHNALRLPAPTPALHPAYKYYTDAEDLLKIEVDLQLKSCYNSLKEYFKDGTAG